MSSSASASASTAPHAYSATRLLYGDAHGTFSGMGLQEAVRLMASLESEASIRAGRHMSNISFENDSSFTRRTGLETGDYAGTTVKSVEGVRNSWQIWKEKVTCGSEPPFVLEPLLVLTTPH